jgi:hypothetical protein
MQLALSLVTSTTLRSTGAQPKGIGAMVEGTVKSDDEESYKSVKFGTGLPPKAWRLIDRCSSMTLAGTPGPLDVFEDRRVESGGRF